MAGNTKLRGFASSTQVQLERWGGVETVDLPESAVSALRTVCYEKLPKRPSQVRAGWDRVEYNGSTGSAETWMSIETVDKFLSFLRDNQIDPSGASEGQTGPRFTQVEVDWWIEEFKGLIDRHRQYHDLTDEPGVR